MNKELDLTNPEAMASLIKFAEMMSQAKTTIPKHLQGQPADCLSVITQAIQWGMNPFSVAQKTHLVGNNLGYEAQLVNAVILNSGAIGGRFHYEFGSSWTSANDPKAWVKVGAVIAGELEITWGEPVYPALQSVKNSPLWKTDPRQQCAYLAVKKWARLYCPGAILGVYTPDELEFSEPEVKPKRTSALDHIVIVATPVDTYQENHEVPEAIEPAADEAALARQPVEPPAVKRSRKKKVEEPAPSVFKEVFEPIPPEYIPGPWWEGLTPTEIYDHVKEKLEEVTTLGDLQTALDWGALEGLDTTSKNALRAVYSERRAELIAAMAA